MAAGTSTVWAFLVQVDYFRVARDPTGIRSSNFPEVNSGEVRGREAPLQPAHAFALLEVCPPDYSNDVGWREIIGERSDREVLPLRKSHGTSRFDVSIGANPLHTATRRAR